ncbi:copper homeostasis membrane protein CopD [Blastomonas sp. CCH2-A2]|uniref:copper homeostasis membrane protein CopD n=1 Tax=Blastomonas sp. CCH2-A2 TaxID=1768788 RepID=UPI00082622D1|nr:copper homeostasis membrane protein CopD [Blastomonas sp. CCH2-A2]
MENTVEPILRFAHYGLLMGMFGWSGFRLLGLKSLDWRKTDRSPGLAMLAALAALLISVALMLISIAAMMGTPVFNLERSMLEAMIFGTDMGYAFIVRTGLLAAGLAAILTLQNDRTAMAIAAGCYAGALVTLGWSGHAATTEGGLGVFHRLNNGAHLLAAGLWLGAIGWFLGLTVRSHRARAQSREQALLEEMHRFAPFGTTLVALVGLSGMINSHLIFGLPNVMTTLETPYGALLAVKVVLVGAMLLCGAYNAQTNRVHHKSTEGLDTVNRAQALAALRRSLAGEFLFGVAVIGLVAVLGTMSPLM